MAQRKKHTAEFKAKVALEALKEASPVNKIAGKYEVHSSQVTQWKKAAKEILKEGFESPKKRERSIDGPSTDELYSKIGQLKVELDWLKKKSEQFDG